MKVLQGSLCVMLAGIGLFADEGRLRISSFTPDEKTLEFKTGYSGTVHHVYRVESTTSLVSVAWSVQRMVGGVGADVSVTNPVTTGSPAMFYRVVASSNSTAFVDGPYMIVDISGGTNATTYPVTYYSSQADVPGCVNSDSYKTDKIILRLIPKGMFTMGCRATDYPCACNSGLHTVTLTKDFYIGVFEVTQRQWELVMGNRPSYFKNTDCYASRPVEQVSYYDIRENPVNSNDPAVNWPANNAVNATSFMGKLRTKTGLSTFDLPMESQWEYACRAGTTTALNSGRNVSSLCNDHNMDVVGRYLYNGGFGYSQNGGTCVGTAKAGSYLPNAWGLYDMHGNTWEWCLDWHGAYPETVTDPLGSSSGVARVLRGASWCNSAYRCRSSNRNCCSPNSRNNFFGFRLARALP